LKIEDEIRDYSSGLFDQLEDKHWNSSEVNKPLNTQNIHKWKKMLSHIDGDIQIIEEVCGREMRRFGYEFTNLSKHKGYYASMFLYYIQFVLLKTMSKLFSSRQH